MIGETDEIPLRFAGLQVRRLLYKDYGIVLPGFDGDDALDAMVWNQVENKRQEIINSRNRPPE